MLTEIILSKSLNQVVFENRNQKYGAFYLRNEYEKNVRKSFLIILLSIISIGAMSFIRFKKEVVIAENPIIDSVKITDIKIEPIVIEQPEPISPHTAPTPPPEGRSIPTVISNTPTPPEVLPNPNTPNTPGDPNGNPNSKVTNPLPPSNGGGTTIVYHESEKKIFDNNMVEKMAEFPGGEEAMYEFLSSHIHFTNSAKQNEVEGKVVLRFIIDESGNITNCKIIRSIGYGLDEIAAEAVSNMPKWKPAIQGDRKVPVLFTLPVQFSLN
jgi:protein TonB